MLEKGGRRVTFSEDNVIVLNNDINESSDDAENMETNQVNSIMNKLPLYKRIREYFSESSLLNGIFTCPLTLMNCLWIITHIIIVIVTYAAILFLLGAPMLPGGSFFGLYWLIIASYVFGWSIAYIPYINLPPVFGMLLTGIIVRTSGLYNIHDQLGYYTTSKIRTVCLAFVTIRAGLQLSTTALIKHPVFLLLLALVPCSIEFFVVGFYSKCVLSYPWTWAFLAGTIVACMSPVVTVNCILTLAEKGYGEDRDMATLFTTASSIDGVHMVSLFGLCYSFVFSGDSDKENIWWAYLPPGFRDLFLGLFFGFVAGLLFAFLPYKEMKYIETYRMSCLIIGSLMCTLGANSIAVSGGGYMASVFMSFIASTGWKMLSGSSLTVMPLRRIIHILWHFSQPILVGIIGAEIDFTHWSSERFGLHIICLFIGLVSRSFCVILTTIRTPFSVRERIFIALSWLPKGTLQAALAPMTLEIAQENNNSDEISLAMDIVQMSVLAIVVLAPVGAIIMTVTGPILLNRIDDYERDRQRRLSLLRLSSLQPVYERTKHQQQRQSKSQQQQEHHQNQSLNADMTNAAVT